MSICISIFPIHLSFISVLVGCIRGPGASSVKDVYCEMFSLCRNYTIQPQHKQDTGGKRRQRLRREEKEKIAALEEGGVR